MNTNADQFLNKHDDLLVSLTTDQPDITEVMPKTQTTPVTLARLTITNYFCYLNFYTELINLRDLLVCVELLYISTLLNSSEAESNFKEQLWKNYMEVIVC